MSNRMLVEAQAALRASRWSEAECHLDAALAANPADDVALALVGELRVGQRRVQEAILSYARAVVLRPGQRVYTERFSELAKLSVAVAWNTDLAGALLVCLKAPEIDCAPLWRFWLSIVAAETRFQAACDFFACRNFDPGNADRFAGIGSLLPFTSSLFVHGLKRIIVYEPVFEEFICHLRRRLLLGPHEHSRELTALAAAIAQYAFHTGYILDASADENRQALQLRGAIEGNGPQSRDAHAIAVLASYFPLCELRNAAQINVSFGRSGPLKELATEQIGQVTELRGVAKAIPTLTPIGPGVSSLVRQQYEAFPYPRWENLNQAKLLRDWEAQEATRDTERMLRARGAQILVLGCGTGRETAILATLFPDAAITAIDLSRASLAYARLKARQFALANVRFCQADILELESFASQFDYVCATGVLHHMEHPATGLEICTNLLKPGGLLRMGLYSETGRSAVAAAREAIEKRGYGSDEKEMLRFRRDSPAFLPQPALNQLIGFTDYFQLSMYRDLLFHVQEHRFTLEEFAELLSRFRLQFRGFYLSNDVLQAYGSECPGDRDRTDLKSWAQFESRHTATFRNMYVFWCRKS